MKNKEKLNKNEEKDRNHQIIFKDIVNIVGESIFCFSV